MTVALTFGAVLLIAFCGDRPDYRQLIDAGSISPIDEIVIADAGLDQDALVPQRAKQILARYSKTLAAVSRFGGARNPKEAGADLESGAPGGSPPDMASIRLASALLRLSCRAHIPGAEHERGIDSLAGFITMAGHLANDDSVVGSQLSAWLLKQFLDAFDQALAIDRVAPADAARLLGAMQRIDPADPVGCLRGVSLTAERWKRLITDYRVAVDAGESPAFPSMVGATEMSPTQSILGCSRDEVEEGSRRVTAALRSARLALVAAAEDPSRQNELCRSVEAQISGRYERAILSEPLLGRSLCAGMQLTAELASQLREWRTTAQAIVDGRFENLRARRSAYFWIQAARVGVAESAEVRERLVRPDFGDAVSKSACITLAEPRLGSAFAMLGGQHEVLDWSRLSPWRDRGVPDAVAGLEAVSVLQMMEWSAECASRTRDRQAIAQAELNLLRAACDACSAGSAPMQIVVRRAVARMLARSGPRMAAAANSDPDLRLKLTRVVHEIVVMPRVDLEGWATGVSASLVGRLALRAELWEVSDLATVREQISERLALAEAPRIFVIASVLDLADWSPDERRDQVLVALGELFWKDRGAVQLESRLNDLRRIEVRLLKDPRAACQILSESDWDPDHDVLLHERSLVEAARVVAQSLATPGD
jgi:hypothetical protein